MPIKSRTSGQPESDGGIRIRFIALTDRGRVRDHNEDAVGHSDLFPSDSGRKLFAVADGMGGHDFGEVASELAIRTLFEHFYSSTDSVRQALREAVDAANDAVYAAGGDRREYEKDLRHRMGTTLVACVIEDEEVTGFNVGDSRAYLLHDRRLRRLTNDQSIIGEQIRARVITQSEARRSPFRGVLLQSIGLSADIDPEQFGIAVGRSDVLLLCSDGLHGVIGDDAILEILQHSTLEQAGPRLIDAANAAGGPDNISVVLVQFE